MVLIENVGHSASGIGRVLEVSIVLDYYECTDEPACCTLGAVELDGTLELWEGVQDIGSQNVCWPLGGR